MGLKFGLEDFLIDREIEKARASKKRTVTLLDGYEIDELDLLSLCENGSMDGARLIVLDNAQKVKIDKAFKAYVEGHTPGDTSTVLVVAIRAEKLPQAWSQISQMKGVHTWEARKFKAWEKDKIHEWVRTEAARLDASIEGAVIDLLLLAVGVDLYRLSNELRKLALLAGTRGAITKEHLKLVVSASPTATQFQVAEFAIAKDERQAMNSLSRLFVNMGDEALVPVVNALMKQIERALIVRKLLDRGVSEDDVAASVGMKPWPFKNNLLPHVQKHSARDLVRHMGRLCKLDGDVKGAARSKRTLVELAVLAIAR